MFVDIEKFEGALAIENLLMPYKKGRLAPDKKTRLPKEPITPQVCMEILRSTNYARNIKDMLLCIAELPQAEQAQFKEVVLATFSNREQPNKQPHNIVLLGKKLAAASGYDAEFAKARKTKEGDLLLSAPNLARQFVTSKTSFANVDFSAYEKLICVTREKIEFKENVKFPKMLYIPFSSEVSFAFYTDYDAFGADLFGVKRISFKDGSKVDFSKTKNLPPQLDVSMCSAVSLNFCDLKDQTNLRFKDGASVDLSYSENLPPELDFSRCTGVCLANCDLKDQPYMYFREGAQIFLSGAKNLSQYLWFSGCSKVFLSGCDLKKIRNLSFREGANVHLDYVKNLSGNLDFSMCSNVDLTGSSLAKVKSLTFKNRAQMEKSKAKPSKSWKGELVFADELSGAELSMLKMAKVKGGR